MNDTLGVIGNTLSEKLPEYWPIIATVLPVLGSALFRFAQKILQKLPTKWRWVNNKLTVSIIGKIIGAVFGKTTLLYNAQIVEDEKAKAELKKAAAKHLSRQGGILQAFNEALDK
jgi:hypothetical protein